MLTNGSFALNFDILIADFFYILLFLLAGIGVTGTGKYHRQAT
jgi:hypothetical protein